MGYQWPVLLGTAGPAVGNYFIFSQAVNLPNNY